MSGQKARFDLEAVAPGAECAMGRPNVLIEERRPEPKALFWETLVMAGVP